jgi:adenosylcobinamide-GDP ribazoletransferase
MTTKYTVNNGQSKRQQLAEDYQHVIGLAVFTEFLIALQFLTVVRVKKNLPFNAAALGRSGAFFPLVGLLLGAALLGLDWICRPFFPPSFLSIVLVLTLILLSRGLHLDGLADTADGLLGSSERQRSLDIMKDSAIGTFGALAVIVVVLLKICALDLLQEGYRGPALLLGPMLSRWACVVMAYTSRPARTEGLGATFVKETQFREFALASVCALGSVFVLLEIIGLVVFLPVAALILIFTLYCNRRLGGVTGDTLGALGEMVETAVWCLFMLLEMAVASR